MKAPIQLVLPAHHKYLNIVGASLAALLERTDGIDNLETFICQIQLATHEACANIVCHAYAQSDDGRIHLTIILEDATGQLQIELVDNGRAYDPLQAPWPPPACWQTKDLPDGPAYLLKDVPVPEPERIRGRGLYLMSQLLDEVVYFPSPEKNRWCLMKRM